MSKGLQALMMDHIAHMSHNTIIQRLLHILMHRISTKMQLQCTHHAIIMG